MPDRARKKLSRNERRNLDIEIGFLAGVARRDPNYEDALRVLGDDYVRRGRYRDSLRVDQQLANLRPQDALVLYNLACSYALNDQPEQAYEALNRAVDRGYRDFRWLSRDPDLASFRRHPLYRKLRSRIRVMRVTVS